MFVTRKVSSVVARAGRALGLEDVDSEQFYTHDQSLRVYLSWSAFMTDSHFVLIKPHPSIFGFYPKLSLQAKRSIECRNMIEI